MFNYLRMDFYRMLHSKTTWIFVGIIIAMVAITTGMMGYLTSDFFKESFSSAQAAAGSVGMSLTVGTPGSGMTNMNSNDVADANLALSMIGGTTTSYLGSVLVSGGALAVLVMLYVALFLASEFDSGFAKNVFTARTNRVAFFASKATFMLAIIVIFSALGFGLLYLGALIVRLPLEAVPLADFAIWYALIVLVLLAFTMLVALVTWFARNKVAGILVTVFVGGSVVYQIISLICQVFPALKEVPNFMLSGCLASLGKATEGTGYLSAPHILGVAVVFLVVFAIGSVLVLKKKDI